MKCPICSMNNNTFKESFFNYDYNVKYDQYQCNNCEIFFSDPFISASSDHYKEKEYYKDRWEFFYVLDYLKLNKNSKILEIGCGEGYFGSHAIKRGLDYFGIDFNSKAVIEAKSKLKTENIFECDLNQFFKDNKFQLDAFFMFHVLEHLDDPIHFIRQVAENVKSGGYIVFSVPSFKRVSLFYNDREKWDNPPHHLTRWNEKSFEFLAKKLNLRILHTAFEPLRFKSFLEFNTLNNKVFSNIIKGYIRKIAKFFYSPFFLLEFNILKRNVSDQAIVIIIRKP